VAAAAVTARLIGTDPVPALWIGATIASGLPDLDMMAMAFGFRGPRVHRNATHSLLVLAVVSLGGWFLIDGARWAVDPGIRWAWIAALFTHPILDVATTSPRVAARGFGIPLLWPISRRRFAARRPVMETLEVETCRSWAGLWEGLRPEFTRLASVSGLIVLLTLVF